MKLLFVCLGNICRSPMAEGLMAHHLERLGLNNHIEVDSCGTGDWHAGELADPRMRSTALKNGIELTHRARQITLQDFDVFDHILVMDHQNLSDVVALNPSMSHKVKLMADWHPEHQNKIVPDPYFGDQKGFDDVFHLLNEITEHIAKDLHQQ
jgi:protein-tyrosine phosphatase